MRQDDAALLHALPALRREGAVLAETRLARRLARVVAWSFRGKAGLPEEVARRVAAFALAEPAPPG